MKRIIAHLRKSWYKYILEVLVIMIGILGAFGLNNWNEGRKDKIEEIKILKMMSRTLQSDIINLKGTISNAENAVTRIERLVHLLEIGTSTKEDSLDTLFGAVYGLHLFQLKMAPFETLETKGLSLISQDSIRISIIQVYESGNRIFEFHNDLERNTTFNLLRTYYMKNFQNLVVWTKATPINFESVFHDKYYRNISEYRLFLLLQVIRNNYVILESMTELEESIEQYLKE